MRSSSLACLSLQYVLCPISGWKCAKCEMRENLWLNLTDGSVLCGKWFFDGSGGNGHALEHYRETNFPLAVKLNTITPDGAGKCLSKTGFMCHTVFQEICWPACISHKHFKLYHFFVYRRFYRCFSSIHSFADVYSFDEEEAVLDPHISEHLLHFGIDMLQMQRVCFYF